MNGTSLIHRKYFLGKVKHTFHKDESTAKGKTEVTYLKKMSERYGSPSESSKMKRCATILIGCLYSLAFHSSGKDRDNFNRIQLWAVIRALNSIIYQLLKNVRLTDLIVIDSVLVIAFVGNV